MIQELLGGGAAGLLDGERKISITSEGFLQTSLSPCPSSSPSLPTSGPPSSSLATSTTATTAASSNPETQNLRCPRCDSTNTKFCYYNNYNLTQPRHFCKTCRRYWTKGGALRNVPIGGGCRKNKTVSNISISAGKSSASAKLKTSFISEIGKQSFLGTGFDHELSSSNHALLWSPPQNSHILALLRAAQNPNPTPTPTPLSSGFALKSDGPISGAQFGLEPEGVTSVLGTRSLNLDTYITTQVPSTGVSSSLWRNNQQPNGLATGEVQNSGIQELFQRLKSSTGSYFGNHQPVALSHNAISSNNNNNNTSSILDAAPVTAGDFGYFNSPFSWSDVATPSGAYP